jgi:protease II
VLHCSWPADARQLLQTADTTGNPADVAAVASQQGLELDTPVKAEDTIQTINENALKQQLVQKKYVELSQQQEQQAMMEENMAILMKQRAAYESAMVEEARKQGLPRPDTSR